METKGLHPNSDYYKLRTGIVIFFAERRQYKQLDFCGKVKITPGFFEKSPKLKGKTKDIMNFRFILK